MYERLAATKASNVWYSYSHNYTFASGAVFHAICKVWLTSGPPEYFTFTYCAWLWNWLIQHFNPCHNVSVMFDKHTIFLLDYLVIVHIQIIGNLNNSDLHIGNLDNREFKAKQPRTTTATSAKRIITKDKKRTWTSYIELTLLLPNETSTAPLPRRLQKRALNNNVTGTNRKVSQRYFCQNLKWRLEHLGALGIMVLTATLISPIKSAVL